jgi:hypothetical protein
MKALRMVDMDAIFIAVSLIVFIWDTARPIFSDGERKGRNAVNALMRYCLAHFGSQGLMFFQLKMAEPQPRHLNRPYIRRFMGD